MDNSNEYWIPYNDGDITTTEILQEASYRMMELHEVENFRWIVKNFQEICKVVRLREILAKLLLMNLHENVPRYSELLSKLLTDKVTIRCIYELYSSEKDKCKAFKNDINFNEHITSPDKNVRRGMVNIIEAIASSRGFTEFSSDKQVIGFVKKEKSSHSDKEDHKAEKNKHVETRKEKLLASPKMNSVQEKKSSLQDNKFKPKENNRGKYNKNDDKETNNKKIKQNHESDKNTQKKSVFNDDPVFKKKYSSSDSDSIDSDFFSSSTTISSDIVYPPHKEDRKQTRDIPSIVRKNETNTVKKTGTANNDMPKDIKKGKKYDSEYSSDPVIDESDSYDIYDSFSSSLSSTKKDKNGNKNPRQSDTDKKVETKLKNSEKKDVSEGGIGNRGKNSLVDKKDGVRPRQKERSSSRSSSGLGSTDDDDFSFSYSSSRTSGSPGKKLKAGSSVAPRGDEDSSSSSASFWRQ